MPTFYLSITPVTSKPIDLGLDDRKRCKYGFNIHAIKHPSETFLEELIGRLVSQSVSLEANIFATSAHAIPDGNGSDALGLLSLRDTGGVEALLTHNDLLGYDRPSAQIIARHENPKLARAKAVAAMDALKTVRNQNL